MIRRPDGQPRRVLITGLMTLAYLLACAAALRPWIAQWEASNPPGDRATRRALSFDPGNDRFQAILATQYQYNLLLRDYPRALIHYQSTLRSNPLDSASWLHLGRLYRKLDRPREADRALHLALQLAPTNAGILWESTVAYLEDGQLTDALGTLRRFISVSPDESERAKAYRLARRLIAPEEALDAIIPSAVSHYSRYTNYLLDQNLGEEAIRAWTRLAQMAARTGEQVDPRLQLRLVDLLMAAGKFGVAHQLWTNVTRETDPDAAPSGSNLVSNGSFERDATVGRGFDWRIERRPGVVCAFDPMIAYAGRRSLRISFAAAHAPFSSVSQVIPVLPDSVYALEAHVRTSGLNDSHSISLEVTDPLTGLLGRTETVSGTRDWTKVGIAFRTAKSSETVTLRVRSEPPSQPERGVAGTAWVDKVSIMKVD